MVYWFDNLVVAALVLGGVAAGRAVRRSPQWRQAIAEVARRRAARISARIVAVYALIALLDSVGWHPPARDASGAVLRDAAGRTVRDARGLTLLDVLLTPWRTAREKTYSAPFATRQFTAEFVRGVDGALVRTHPPLRYPRRHPLGTDRIGEDVFYQALKGVRTGMLLGVFTTLIVVPFALLFGLLAGYYGGWVDDVVQYVYTVLASIPAVLLVMAFMVLFGRGLTQLCVILGVTTWTGLCRVLRGETMKLRESDFVAAARAMSASSARILWRHIVPNVMHLVLITTVLGFSGRVLSEAALTYMGIGVGVDTYSWGRMINDARLELARDPVIWWKLAAAFAAMVGLVLPANVLGDALRDALDPRLRSEPV
ncbi:MAG: ABC transporter permease [Kiritimatiellae bacterium]|nr:ABC transporter permease [Kiritimatiellia bacterium]